MSDFEQFKQEYGLENYRFWIVLGYLEDELVLVIEKDATIIYANYNELKTTNLILKRQNATYRFFHSIPDPRKSEEEFQIPDFTDFGSLEELQKYTLIQKVVGI